MSSPGRGVESLCNHPPSGIMTSLELEERGKLQKTGESGVDKKDERMSRWEDGM